MKTKILTAMLLAAFLLMTTGCEKKGPAEQAGEKIDKAVSEVKENTKNAVEKAGDAIEDAGDKIEDKTD